MSYDFWEKVTIGEKILTRKKYRKTREKRRKRKAKRNRNKPCGTHQSM